MAQKRKDNHIIVAIHVTNRVKQASGVQSVLTRYGTRIRTRIGLHESTGRKADPNGVILLELVGAERQSQRLMADLNAVAGVEAKGICFQH